METVTKRIHKTIVSVYYINTSYREGESLMKIIKRNGTEVTFDLSKIRTAIEKANESVLDSAQMTKEQIDMIS